MAVLGGFRSLYELAFARADHRGASALAEFMRDIAERHDDPAGFVVSQLALGRTLWCQGQLTAAREHLERGLRVARTVDAPREPLPPVVTLHLQLAAVLDALDQPDAAASLISAAVGAARDETPFARAATLTSAGLVAALRRDVAAARTWATEALQVADRWGFPAPGGYAAVVLSWVQAIEGDPAAAIPDLRGHLDMIEAGGAQHLLAWGFGLLAEAHLRNRQPVEALRLLDDALARVDRTGERLYEAELHRLRALCLLQVTPPRQAHARDAFDRAMAVARAQGATLLRRRVLETSAAAALSTHKGSDHNP